MRPQLCKVLPKFVASLRSVSEKLLAVRGNISRHVGFDSRGLSYALAMRFPCIAEMFRVIWRVVAISVEIVGYRVAGFHRHEVALVVQYFARCISE